MPSVESIIKRIASLEAENRRLREALEGVLPFMEEAEKNGLVGHEGCFWAVEFVRDALDNGAALQGGSSEQAK